MSSDVAGATLQHTESSRQGGVTGQICVGSKMLCGQAMYSAMRNRNQALGRQV